MVDGTRCQSPHWSLCERPLVLSRREAKPYLGSSEWPCVCGRRWLVDGEGCRMCLAGCESCESEASCGGGGAGTSLEVLSKRRVPESAEESVWRAIYILIVAMRYFTRSPRIWFLCAVDPRSSLTPSTSGAYLNLAFPRGLGLLDQLRYVPKTLERHVSRQGVGQGFTRQLLRVNVVELE